MFFSKIPGEKVTKHWRLPVGVHGVDDVGVLLGALSALASLQEEGILEKKSQCVFKVHLLSRKLRVEQPLGLHQL